VQQNIYLLDRKKSIGRTVLQIADLQHPFKCIGDQRGSLNMAGCSGADFNCVFADGKMPELGIECRNSRYLAGSNFSNPADMLQGFRWQILRRF
jgi:hypothetical protein